MSWISLGEALQRAMDEWHWQEIEEKNPTKVVVYMEWEDSAIVGLKPCEPGEEDEI